MKPEEKLLPGTLVTLDHFIFMLERAGREGIHEIRRALNKEDFDLVEDWLSQLEWMVSQIDNAAKHAPDKDKWRLTKALIKMIWPLSLLAFALRFPRLSMWLRLA